MSYPQIDDDKFNEKINNKYEKFKIPKKRKSFDQICFPKRFELQQPQKFLANYINPKSPYKGILVFHQIGSGKTCTAVNIAEQWKQQRRVVVVVPASLIGNFKNELRSQCAENTYISQDDRKLLNNLDPAGKEYKNIIKQSNERIKKYYDIYSYNKFIEKAETGSLKLNNKLLIIDEIQNMVSEEGKYYRVLYKTIHEAPQNLRIVLLSATPMFDKPIEIALTMNLLRLPFELPTGREFANTFIDTKVNKNTQDITFSAKNLDIFKERVKGYVSYFRGAPPYVFPEERLRIVKCEMSQFQLESYKTVLKNEEQTFRKIFKKKLKKFMKGNIVDLPNNFYIGTRIISNIAFPNKQIGEEGYKSLKNKFLELENIKNYSIKFYKIIKRIQNSTGLAFVYSNFKQYGGVKSFTKILDAHGYKNYVIYGQGPKRYAVWSGDESNDVREEIKAVFNQKSNYNGSKIKILIGTKSISEGASFKNIRSVHLMDPYWNWSRILQIIGRASRFCSHKDLPEERRNVRIYIYLAMHETISETVDQYLLKLALKKHKLISEFEKALKEAAIDCELFKNANIFEGEELICQA